MPDSLFERLKHLRRRVAQLVSVYGASWIVAVVLAATLAVCTLDWLVHLDDPGVRLILGLGILTGGGWVAWKTLIAPLRRSFSDVELALRIERRYPGFRDSLASTVQFLSTDHDARLGSPEMQKRVVNETLARIDAIDVDDVVETREVRRIAAAALVVCLSAAAVGAMNQSAAAMALHRLFLPFSAGAWPRATELRLLNAQLQPVEHDPGEPLRAALGSVVELYVDNVRGALPDDVRLELGKEGAAPSREKLRRTTIRDEQGRPRDVCAVTIPAQRGQLRFRAVGGDDDRMPWWRLEAVPPPVVEELGVRLTPPKYSGRPVETLPQGVGHVQGLVGTRVEIRGTASKPLQGARLLVKDAQPAPMELDEEGTRFTVSFTVAEPGVYSYWFDLKDRQGFENPEAPRYEIRGIADLPPEVTIDDPPADLTVTADAEIPFRVTARDDLGVTGMSLVHRVGDDASAPTASVPLFDAATSAERAPPPQRTEERLFRLKPLAPSPGMRIHVHGEATDEYDLFPDHVGRSHTRVLTVVSQEEKSIELAARQSSLVDELDRIVQSQRRAREQVGELVLQLEKAGRLQPADIDLLKRIELDQKQLASRLADPADSLETRARGIVRELERNRLDDPATKSRLEQLADDVGLLREENLPKIDQELTRARKTVLDQQPAGGTPPSEEPRPAATSPAAKPDDPKSLDDQTGALRRAGEQQGLVLETLSEQLRKLSEWRSRRDLTSELTEMIAGQKQLNEETGEVGRKTLSKTPSELTPQERADLARLSERQSRQGDRVSQFRAKLSDLADELDESNPDTARTLRDAEEELRKGATADRLREAANELEKNNIGRATAAQQKALDELTELENTLRDRGASDTETLVKKLKEAEARLDALRKREETLQKKLKDAGENDDAGERKAELERLRKEQEKVREEMEGMARRLRRNQAKSAGEAARRSASRMQNAEQHLGGDEAGAAGDDVQNALDDLEQAQREVAQQRREAEEQLAREMLERIADGIRSMIERQQSVIDETDRLNGELRQRGNWTRGQLKSLVSLADVEKSLKEETERLAEKIKAAEVFALALRGAARQMQTAAARLSERKTDAATLDAERAALKRFLDLAESLKPEKPKGKPDEEDKPKEGEDQPPKEDGPPADGIPQLAQLKMLKSMQEDLLERTTRLDAIHAKNGELSPEEQAELDALALEQGQLADLARNLVKNFARPSDDDGAKPDERKPDERKPDERKPDEKPRE